MKSLSRVAAAVIAVAALPALVTLTPASAAPPGPTEQVVIAGQPGQGAAVERAVAAAHGTVVRRLPLVNGVSARVPVTAELALRHSIGVRSLTPDTRGRLLSYNSTLGYDPVSDMGGLNAITQITDVQRVWKAGYTGKGVDVALIDSGVAHVPGLDNGNVVNGPDLSFDSQNPYEAPYQDEFGHGTHMASLIAGRDSVQSKGTGYVSASASQYVGMAPDARVVNVKVAAADGGADVSQVIAAINWVTQHAHDPGMNIRVLSLSYGTQSTQSYTLDPLCYAVEQAWKKGIFVVVAGGNDGVTTTSSLADPAMDPYVLAVGADDPQGTISSTDDTVPTFATHGTNQRHVDLVAPAVHVLGLRDPGGQVDLNYPNAVVGTRFIRGSGTSQATALVAGAAADLLQKYPTMAPDQLKATLMQGAVSFSGSSVTYRGSGLLDVGQALNGGVSQAGQTDPAATGTGSLEQARGGSHVVDPDTGSTLSGEQDIFGKPFNSASWAQLTASNSAWNGGSWNGSVWTGASAGASGWSVVPWTSVGWDSHSWTSHSWTSHSWTSAGWDSHSWTDSAWDSHSWTSSGWDSHSWTGAGWASGSWS